MPRQWTEFSERQEVIREVEAFVSMLPKPEEGRIDPSSEIRSLPVKVRFQLLEQEYPGEFRLCSEDTCNEEIVPSYHSHVNDCERIGKVTPIGVHTKEECGWMNPIEIKKISMLRKDDSEESSLHSAGGDYVKYWDDLHLDFPPGKTDDWSTYTYAKSMTVTRQSNPRKVMKEEFTLKETLPNNAYGGVYGAEDGVDYSLSTATAKTSNRSTPRKAPKRSGFSGLTLQQMRQVMIDTVGIDPLKDNWKRPSMKG